MAPTVEEQLAREAFAVGVIARVSGLPYLWASFDRPAGWEQAGDAVGDTLWIDGEVYRWQTTLTVTRKVGGASFRAMPKAGLGSAGDISVELSVTGMDRPQDDALLSLLVRDLFRRDESLTHLGDDYLADSTAAIPVTGGSEEFEAGGAASADQRAVFIKQETLRAGDELHADETLIDGPVTRGRYGSWPMSHRAVGDLQESESGSGVIVSSWPIVWGGRLLDVWFVLGRKHRGAFDPMSASAAGAAILHWFSGELRKPEEGGDTLAVELLADSLDQLLARPVCSRQPVGRVLAAPDVTAWATRDPLKRGGIKIGPENWWLSWSLIRVNKTTGDVTTEGPYLKRLSWIRLPGTITLSVVERGSYTIDQVAQMIQDTLETTAASTSTGTMGWFVNPGGSAGWFTGHKIAMRLTNRKASAQDRTDDALYLHPTTINGPTILHTLGFTEDNDRYENLADPSSSATWVNRVFLLEANDEPLAFHWPARPPYPTQLAVEQTSGPDFNAKPGWETDAGATMAGYCRLQNGPLLRMTKAVQNSGRSTRWLLDVDVDGFGAAASETPEIELRFKNGVLPEEDLPEVKQVVCFRQTTTLRALRYLWHSGTGVPGTLHADWDQGWHGSGLALPSRLLDLDGIEAVNAELNPRRDVILIEEPTPLRRWLESELLLDMCLLMPGRSDDGANYWLRLIEVGLPLESLLVYDADRVRVLDETNSLTFKGRGSGGVGLDRNEEKILNRATVKIGYDVQSKKHRTTINQRDLVSIENWGSSQALDLDVGSITNAGSGARRAARFFENLIDRFGRPYEILEKSTAHALTWLWRVGDYVVVVDATTPSLDRPGRGLEVMGQILQLDQELLDARGSSGDVTVVAYKGLGDRVSAWAPSLKLLASVGGGDTIWSYDPDGYSLATDPDDGENFDVLDEVIIWQPGTTNVLGRVITAIDTVLHRITFGVGVFLTGPLTMSWGSYNDPDTTGSQRRFVAASVPVSVDGVTREGLSDGDGVYHRPFVYVS